VSNVGAIKDIVDELRAQHWDVVPIGQGAQWRATPPAGSTVTFNARPPSAQSVQMILRDLKQQGFAWPPPKGNGVAHHKADPKPSAAPFNPVLHPDAVVTMATAPRPLARALPPPMLSIVPMSSPSEDFDEGDRLFQALKDCRELAAMGRADVDEKQRAAEAANQALEVAIGQQRRLEQELEQAMQKFTQYFGAQR
jgi:hypothetical protein